MLVLMISFSFIFTSISWLILKGANLLKLKKLGVVNFTFIGLLVGYQLFYLLNNGLNYLSMEELILTCLIALFSYLEKIRQQLTA